MNLLALPAFADNYIWMVHDDARAFVVDPGDAAPVIEALRTRGLQLAGQARLQRGAAAAPAAGPGGSRGLAEAAT